MVLHPDLCWSVLLFWAAFRSMTVPERARGVPVGRFSWVHNYLFFLLRLTRRSFPQINTRIVERDIYDGDSGLDKSGLWTAKAKL